jgi:hypothetical protein
MSEYLILVSFWIPLMAAVAVYIFTRRILPRSLGLFAFDCAVLSVDAFLCVAFWWREITGRISQDVWLDEYGFMALLVPMWATVISAPLLLVAGVIRRRLFSTVSGHATQAA